MELSGLLACLEHEAATGMKKMRPPHSFLGAPDDSLLGGR